MTAFMGKDIVCGVKMITLSGKLRHNVAQRIRFFVGGTFLSCISIVSRHGGQCGFWISVSNTEDQYMFYVSTIYNISSKVAQVLEFSVGSLLTSPTALQVATTNTELIYNAVISESTVSAKCS